LHDKFTFIIRQKTTKHCHYTYSGINLYLFDNKQS